MLSLILLLIANAVPELRPPGPPLPEGYKFWIWDSDSCKGGDTTYIYKQAFLYKVHLKDCPLPFSLEVPGLHLDSTCYASKDCTAGIAFYEPRDTVTSFEHPYQSYVEISWGPRLTRDLNPGIARRDLLCHMAIRTYTGFLDGKGVEETTINGLRAFRVRGRWMHGQCDIQFIDTGYITAYLIFADKYVFLIKCKNLIYSRISPPIEGIEDEAMADSISANWQYDYYYHDNIRKLERAVEQTFRPKE